MAGPERAAGRIGRAVGPVLIVVWTAVPLLWLLSLSLKGGDHINDGRFWPAAPTLHNYRTVFRTDLFTSALRNSIGISPSTGSSLFATGRTSLTEKSRAVCWIIF